MRVRLPFFISEVDKIHLQTGFTFIESALCVHEIFKPAVFSITSAYLYDV